MAVKILLSISLEKHKEKENCHLLSFFIRLREIVVYTLQKQISKELNNLNSLNKYVKSSEKWINIEGKLVLSFVKPHKSVVIFIILRRIKKIYYIWSKKLEFFYKIAKHPTIRNLSQIQIDFESYFSFRRSAQGVKSWVWTQILFKEQDHRIQHSILWIFYEKQLQNYTSAPGTSIVISIFEMNSIERRSNTIHPPICISVIINIL